MALTPEEKKAIKEELERRKAAASKPETYVTDEQYDELERLYNAAKKSAAGDPNKVTPETEAFQRRYHELLPDEAKKIIGSNPKKTAKAIKLGLSATDLEGNAEGMFGPRTEQYWQSVKKKPAEEQQPEKEKEDIKVAGEPEEETDKERDPFKTYTPTNYQLPQNAPWWLQDIIKTAGAATDLARIKRYQPWQATPQYRLPDATFYDPTRELAANTEQANLAYQAQQAFTNPQQLAAASAITQGQAAKNAADIMGRYNNLNVGLANQLEGQRTDIMNAASQNKANLDTQLWDKYTIMNQQFDNSKAQARQNLRQSYIDAITNKANTYNLNQLYPQYAINPMTGGQMYFRPDGSTIKGTNSQADIESQYNKALKLTGDPDRALRLLTLQSKGNLSDENAQDYVGSYQGSANTK
jgi:hypothetical protein